MFDAGILIVPAVAGLVMLGWLLPALALLCGLAPLVALLLCLRPSSPTETWHGR
jgi:hypothetical protein